MADERRETEMAASEVPEIVTRAMGLNGAVAADLSVFGGILRCGKCGAEMPLGDVASHLGHGWPKCCGQTMTWVTLKQLAAEREVPDGYELVAVVNERWRLESGKSCRRRGCPNRSAAELNRARRMPAKGLRPARMVDAWWPYCLSHLYGNWIENGRVWHWILREKPDV
jgi:hypothetical protein